MLEFNDKMVEADDAYGTLCAGRKAVKPLSVSTISYLSGSRCEYLLIRQKDATNSAASSQQPLNMNSLLELQQDSPSPPHMVPPTQPQQRDQAVSIIKFEIRTHACQIQHLTSANYRSQFSEMPKWHCVIPPTSM